MIIVQATIITHPNYYIIIQLDTLPPLLPPQKQPIKTQRTYISTCLKTFWLLIPLSWHSRSSTVRLLPTFPKCFTSILNKHVLQSFTLLFAHHKNPVCLTPAHDFLETECPPTLPHFFTELTIFAQVISFQKAFSDFQRILSTHLS